MDGASLGSASLILEADLSQLRADLDDAKARVAAAALEMQRMLDRHVQVTGQHFGILGSMVGTRLEQPMERSQTSLGLWAAAQEAALAKVRGSIEQTDAAYVGMADTAEAAADIQVAASGRVVEAYGAQAEAARLAADAEEAAAARAAAARSVLGRVGYDVMSRGPVVAAAEAGSRAGGEGLVADTFSNHSGVWGVRGPVTPGSIANPVVVVMEAASRTPLGTLAAAIGEDSSGGGAEGASVTKEQGGTRTVVAAAPGEKQPQAQRPVAALGLEAQRHQAMEDALTAAKANLAGAVKPATQAQSTEPVPVAVKEDKTSKETGNALANALLADAAAKETPNQKTAAKETGNAVADALLAVGSKKLAPGQKAQTAPGYERAYELLGYTVASRVSGGPGRLYAPGGQPGTENYGTSEEAALIAAQRAASGGSGGGGVPPWLTALLWGHAGGGGGNGGGGYNGAGTGMLGHLFFAGAGGMAGFGSLGSFAGFGPEHLALTLGGIAGSGVAAMGGGALLGLGGLGKLGAGMGSDMGVSSSAIADTTSLYTGYEKLREAVAQYGKSSKQAKEAQAELNATMKYTLSGTKGVAAELGLAEKVSALNVQWDKQTSGARTAFVHLAEPLVEIGSHWIPAINKAAEQNFTSMAQSLKPFFSYLKGPEAMGLFEQLEDEFHEQIPTAMKALDEGFQFFGKTIGAVAPLTGGLMKDLDDFFTKMDEPQHFAHWEEMMSHMIGDFHVWGAFIKELGGALVDLFDKDAHTGEGIIEELTGMLHKVREYEDSVTGGAAIHNIFVVHKKEAEELLEVLVPLLRSFTGIYTTISPPLVEAVTKVAEAFTFLLTKFEDLGSAAKWVVGLTLMAAKLKVLVPLLKQAGLATGALSGEVSGSTKMSDLTVAQAKTVGVIPAGGTAAAGEATAGADVGEEALSGALLTDAAASIKTRVEGMIPDLLKGALAGVVASMGASALGVHGTPNTALSTGVGVGVAGTMALGPEVGIPAGLATAGLVEAIHALNKKAPEYGQQFAEAYYKPFGVILPKTVTEPLEAAMAKIRNERAKAEHPERSFLEKAEHAIDSIGSHGGPPPPKANTKVVHKKEEEEGANTAEAFKQGFRKASQKSAFGFSLSAFQSLFDMGPTARKAAAKAMLEYAAELVKNKGLPANALGEIIHQLERYFPELTASFQKEGANTSKELTAALNLKEAQANTNNALTAIDRAFGTSSLTVSEALKATEYAVAHSTGAEKHYWEEKLSALQHATHEETKAAKASAAAQLESLHHLDAGLKAGVVSWETYAEGVTAWSEKLSERVGNGMETLAQGITTINKMLEGELGELGVSKSLGHAFVTGKMPTAKTFFSESGVGTPEGAPLKGGLGHAQGGLLQIGRPGEAGRDTVGLNVGGLPIAVAPGEQVAVFNRHQLPIVNAALAPMGGLPGLFSQVSTPNYMASGGIVAPRVSGAGAIPDIVRGGLAEVAKAANAKVGKASAASYSGNGGKGSGGSPSANEKLGREMMIAAGFPASEWPYLQELWTRESGWSDTAENQPGAGWLANGNASGIPQSDGHGNVYPKGDARAQIAWGLNYIKENYHGSIRLANEVDKGGSYAHGGLLGFALGGLVPGFAGGTAHVASAKKPASGRPKKAKKLPKVAHLGTLNPFTHIPSLMQLPNEYQQQLAQITSIMEGQIPQIEEEYTLAEGADTRALSARPHGGEFVITPSAYEKTLGITLPFEDTGNVELRRGQLTGLFDFQSDIQARLQSVLGLTAPVTAGTVKAIQERKKGITELHARIKKLREELAAKLKKIRDEIRANLQKMKAIEEEIQKEKEKKLPQGKGYDAAKEAQDHAVTKLEGRITKLKDDNKKKGGDETEVGTGGEIGAAKGSTTKEVGKLEAKATALLGQQKELEERHKKLEEDTGGILGLSGHGGSMAATQAKEEELNQQIGELGGVPQKVKEAIAEAGGGPESAAELAEREKAQLEEKLKISHEELRIEQDKNIVFDGPGDIGYGGINALSAAASRGMLLPLTPLPYAGSFDTGGVIPGPVGAAHVAVVHGGEEVLTPEQRQGGGVHFHQHNEINTLHPGDPTTLRAIGDASVQGQRLQGYRLSKRVTPGI